MVVLYTVVDLKTFQFRVCKKRATKIVNVIIELEFVIVHPCRTSEWSFDYQIYFPV